MLPPHGKLQLAPPQLPEASSHVPFAQVNEAEPTLGAALSDTFRVVPCEPAVAEALQVNELVVQFTPLVVQLAHVGLGQFALL